MARDQPEAWREVCLGEVTVERGDRVGKRESSPTVLSCTKHYGLVPSDEYFKGRTIYSDNLTNYKLVLRDWFAYATNHLAEGSIGLQEDFGEACVSPIYTVFAATADVDPPFLRRVLKHWRTMHQYKVHEQATVDRRGAIRYRDFSKITATLPPLPEQRQIVAILDTLDAAIRKTEAIIAKLNQVKQGLLHDLLTRGIDDNGELRDPERRPEQFKDSPLGRIPRDWSIERIADLCESSAFGPRFSSEHYDQEGPLATLRTTDMDDEGNITLSTMPRAKILPSSLSAHLLRKDDLLISRSGTCGIAAVFPGHNLAVVPGAFLIRFRLKQAGVAHFLRRYFNSGLGRPRLDRLAVGGVQKNLKGSSVLALHIPLPPSEEIGRITTVVCASEAEDSQEAKQLSKLRLLRQGLMEDLLTGRVRVTKLLEEAAE